MLIIRGAYHFRPTRVAFRNDYCLSCQAPRRAIAVRSFDVGHFFWVPILPVGYWRHWKCSECRRKPHSNLKLRRRLKWATLYSLVGRLGHALGGSDRPGVCPRQLDRLIRSAISSRPTGRLFVSCIQGTLSSRE